MKLTKRTILVIIVVALLITLILDWEDARQGFIDGYNSKW